MPCASLGRFDVVWSDFMRIAQWSQKPVIRDSQMFNRAEVTMGPASCEMTYKIQKWNVNSDGFHSILVANARVDWLAGMMTLPKSSTSSSKCVFTEGVHSPCRAVRLVNFPSDGHAPCACATGSDTFPPKSSGAVRSGIDEAMGPWLCPQEGDVLLLAQQTVHMDSECLLITRRTYPLQMCYCVTKLHRCFHYDVDSDFVLHSNCRCSENVDVDTDKVWPVVIMCRRCFPFPERLIESNSHAHADGQ